MRRLVTGNSRSRERGAIVAVVALLLVLLLMFLMLVMNVGHGFSVRSELQNAGDSAALAAAMDIGGNDVSTMRDHLTAARRTAVSYAAAHTTDTTRVSLLNTDVCFGTMPTPDGTFQQLSCGGGLSDAQVYSINAVRVGAVRDAGHSASGGALTVFGSGLFGSTGTTDVWTSATAARFAPCNVTCAAPIVFTQQQIDDDVLPCERSSQPLRGNQVGFTTYTTTSVTSAQIQNLLMTGGGPRRPPRCDPRWCRKESPPLTASSINIQSGNAIGGGAYSALSSCLQGATVDVGIVGGSVPSSGTHRVTTWARVKIVSVNPPGRRTPATITIQRECGESEQDATAGVAGRCRAVGLLSTRPVLVY